ncbi:hypothetical protein HYPSUDRAFT_148930 [Hypholoma sublateritium FD-334 SS-4]|uniref:Uncharacterized protein n=1 Tax=Hypholoma sublateritium (strain FD-334 SS-4) TaxID=945553 RepID=A0A0D2N909_HYPSF|nr:hypothetical protein HYPSUDRAFT_148930 [Hypholoma sublateritium FD-334 SS-4]
MKFSTSSLFHVIEVAFLASTSLVLACEGDCIVGITNAFIGNYTAPKESVLEKIAERIVSELIPNNKENAISYLKPVIEEYNKRAYDYMENAIFKSCFHGKCLDPDTGLEPAGCPDPDCPLICGTPGSLIHFYNRLQDIAFNSTASLFNDIIVSDSAAYRQVEQRVVKAASSNRRRRFLRFKRYDLARQSGLGRERNFQDIAGRGEKEIRQDLKIYLQQFRTLLSDACGGIGNGIPNCSWKRPMGEYILSFP